MIKTDAIKEFDKDTVDNLMRVWESSVRDTHTFLAEQDIISLRPLVAGAFKEMDIMLVIKNASDEITAFLGIKDNKIEMLFVDSLERGKQLGKRLVLEAISNYSANLVDVNEQNEQAVGFYKHIGFEVFERSELDAQGNPFPILHMKIE